ncbi:MAG: YqeG family HAD IIIA-type phosphatase [Syntrophomonadaceae bacterium]|nr:YqeG family HAD IIIA-type phosphatase [Syntrophomonadaceae bacterium]
MQKIFYPDIYVDSVLDIPLDCLRNTNITSLILDLDNTITEWNSNRLAPEIAAWISDTKNKGFKVCIVSNNNEKRVLGVAEVLDIPCVCRAGKPLARAFRRALAKLGATPHETAMVGDQIFTDILGGNLMGMITILVSPINKREFMGTRIMRQVEKLVLTRLPTRMEKDRPYPPSGPGKPG